MQPLHSQVSQASDGLKGELSTLQEKMYSACVPSTLKIPVGQKAENLAALPVRRGGVGFVRQ